jgi:predicted DNA-binding transcriptional regulator AlpA
MAYYLCRQTTRKAAPVSSTDQRVLSSWKEIAEYLGKGRRTAQRWENELGLPVRRTREGVKSAVLAVPEEIDAWVQSLKFQNNQQAALTRSLRNENLRLRHDLALARVRISSLERNLYHEPPLSIRGVKLG